MRNAAHHGLARYGERLPGAAVVAPGSASALPEEMARRDNSRLALLPAGSGFPASWDGRKSGSNIRLSVIFEIIPWAKPIVFDNVTNCFD
jgi:hypothetical protein